MRTVVHTYSDGYSIYFRVSETVVCELVYSTVEEIDTCQVFHGEASFIGRKLAGKWILSKLDDQEADKNELTHFNPSHNPGFKEISAEDILKRWVMASMI